MKIQPYAPEDVLAKRSDRLLMVSALSNGACIASVIVAVIALMSGDFFITACASLLAVALGVIAAKTETEGNILALRRPPIVNDISVRRRRKGNVRPRQRGEVQKRERV